MYSIGYIINCQLKYREYYQCQVSVPLKEGVLSKDSSQ